MAAALVVDSEAQGSNYTCQHMLWQWDCLLHTSTCLAVPSLSTLPP